MDSPKIALIHDWLVEFGGAEQILAAVLEIWPDAHIYTLVHDPNGPCGQITVGRQVETSFIQKLPRAKRKYRSYLPLMPLAVEQFDLRPYDIVFSISYAVSHGVITGTDQLHINYICSPMRYAWHLYQQYLDDAGLRTGLKSWFARGILHYLRIWDVSASHRIDEIVAISHWTAANVKKYYHRNASVIYPPVDIERFKLCPEKANFYLTVSRLVPYKKIDLIVAAFSKMPDKKLVVIGDGPDFRKVQRHPGGNIEFLGFQPDQIVTKYMLQARAFVFAAIEDYGIVPLEAQACGTPVIAYGRGGVQESMIDGKTGIFYSEQSTKSLVGAVERFENEETRFDRHELRQNAERFSKERFQGEMQKYIELKWDQFLDNGRDIRLMT